MRGMALETTSSRVNAEKPYLTTFQCLWVRFPSNMSETLQPSMTSEVHGPKVTTQFFTGPNSGVCAVYERLEKPMKDRLRFSEKDQVALIERWGHLKLVPNLDLTLKDAYDDKLQSGLVSLEEGVVEHWSFSDRIVLVGDSAHKFTPSTDAGCNNGIIDVVALANELHRTIEEARLASKYTNAVPSREKLEAAFTAYQTERQDTVAAECKQCGNATQMATWKTSTHWFIDRWVLPFKLVQKAIFGGGLERGAKAPVLDYVPSEELFSGETHGCIPCLSRYSKWPMILKF